MLDEKSAVNPASAACFVALQIRNDRRNRRFAPSFHQFIGIRWRELLGIRKLRTSTTQHHHPNPEENIMNTNTFNKDNAGSTVLLAAMLLTIAAATFGSFNVEAKAANVQATANQVQIETLVVTDTRLK